MLHLVKVAVVGLVTFTAAPHEEQTGMVPEELVFCRSRMDMDIAVRYVVDADNFLAFFTTRTWYDFLLGSCEWRKMSDMVYHRADNSTINERRLPVRRLSYIEARTGMKWFTWTWFRLP